MAESKITSRWLIATVPTQDGDDEAPGHATSGPDPSTQQCRATHDELRIAIITWIERTYHRRRRQDRLGRLTPIEYETIMTPTATAA